MATKKKKKKTTTEAAPPAPTPRNLNEELGQLIPRLGELGGIGSDQYLKNQKDLTQYQYDFFKQHYQELVNEQIEGQSKATTRSRNDALNYLGTMGPQARANARAANPEWAAATDKTMQMLGQTGQPLAHSPFEAELDRQAMDELKLGGALTPEEERASQQSARTAFAARGQALGGASAVAEVLNRDSMSQARLRERQGIAAGREQVFGQRQQLEEAHTGADRSFALAAGQQFDSQSPIWKILGQNANTTQPEQLLGFTSGVQGFNPTQMYGQGMVYGMDLFNTNTNMQASIYNSYQNNQASLQAAKIQADAQIKAANSQAGAAGSGGSGVAGAAVGAAGAAVAGAAAAVGLCWVARAVFGAADKRWRIFKVWLLLEAPRSLREFYREHGEAIASQVAKLPHIKAALRQIMEPVVA